MSQATANQKPSTAIADAGHPMAVGFGDLLESLVVTEERAKWLKRYDRYKPRVKMTRLGKREKLDGSKHRTTGKIVGESKDGQCWYIIRDGETTRRLYHKQFWRLSNARAQAPPPETEPGCNDDVQIS
jgi:hypothetical protein